MSNIRLNFRTMTLELRVTRAVFKKARNCIQPNTSFYMNKERMEGINCFS